MDASSSSKIPPPPPPPPPRSSNSPPLLSDGVFFRFVFFFFLEEAGLFLIDPVIQSSSSSSPMEEKNITNHENFMPKIFNYIKICLTLEFLCNSFYSITFQHLKLSPQSCMYMYVKLMDLQYIQLSICTFTSTLGICPPLSPLEQKYCKATSLFIYAIFFTRSSALCIVTYGTIKNKVVYMYIHVNLCDLCLTRIIRIDKSHA